MNLKAGDIRVLRTTGKCLLILGFRECFAGPPNVKILLSEGKIEHWRWGEVRMWSSSLEESLEIENAKE